MLTTFFKPRRKERTTLEVLQPLRTISSTIPLLPWCSCVALPPYEFHVRCTLLVYSIMSFSLSTLSIVSELFKYS
nr:MAG TPA: hypothetical protein [Caudoviricetes sp.]